MRRPGDAPGRRPKQEQFFFEKEPKNFCHWCRAWMGKDAPCAWGLSGSFLLLFFKKEGFSLLLPPAEA
jgi:hypothetical protein